MKETRDEMQIIENNYNKKEEIILSEEKKLKEKKKKNIELYKKYRVIAWDMIFYYTMIYLFFTTVKGITPAEVLKLEAFYIFFKFLVQISCTLIIQKIGKRKSLIFANLIGSLHILVIMFAPNFYVLLLSQLMCAISFVIKSTCETDMLYDSIEHGEKRGSIFAKIDGKAMSRNYYIDAITAAVSGFLFVINPYIPLSLCFTIFFIAFIMSTGFEEIHDNKDKKVNLLDEIKNIKISFKSIFKSNRLKSLIIFNGIFVSLIKILQNLRNTVLTEVGVPEQYFGIIFAVMGIILGTSARLQGIIQKKFKNRTLAFLSLPTAISCLLLGVILLYNVPTKISIPLILVIFAVQYEMRGPYNVLIKQYFNNFTNSEKRVKISTTNNLCECLISSVLTYLASYILDLASIQYTTIIVGCVFTIILVLLLDKMRGTVGLKMNEYDKNELL